MDEDSGLWISLEDEYLSITIDYKNKPAFIAETIDDLFEGE